MESPPESVLDYFAAGTTEKDQGSKLVKDANLEQKVGQIVDEYGSLPHHLKRLFLYCSLFPSGYEFSKVELIQLWVAEGFIRERQNQRMEDTASEHFNSLVKEGFFVPSICDFAMYYDSVLSAPTDNLSNFVYKVNPNKHSILEHTISPGNYFRAVDGKLDGVTEMTRHLSLICEDIDGMTFGILQNFKQLRTLHLLSCRGSSIKHVPRDFCFTLTFLRTLNLSGTLISELPSSIGNVKSLRYIDASHTPISRLPESVDSLHKLQTIRLRGCMHFVQLPKGMMKLSNLRHIDLDIIRQLDSMPAHIGNLSNLQTLPAFLVGRDDGCHVGELKNLNDLKGVFNISRLENVLSKEEAEEAALSDKKFIHSLELRWSNLFVEYAEQQEKVLECLQPHFGLKGLQIQQYSGSILPTWINNPAFADLVAITLYRCRNCKLLPCMGQLPALKSLSIIEVNEVKKINHQFFRNGPVDPAFPKLERLEVDIMLNLKEWMDVQMGDLPSLVKLTVDSCPELVTIPPLSCLKSLKHLEFRRCPKLLSLPIDGLPTSLESFLILGCLELKEWCLSGEHWSMLCHVPSVWFDNEEGPRGITYQSTSSNKTRNCSGASGSGNDYIIPYPDQVLENVLENVLCFLTARQDRNAASLVCKSWYHAEALTRSELFIGNCYAVSPRRATSRFTRVRAVSVKGKPRFADFNLMPANWGAHFAPWVSAMAKAYPWLEKVYLKRMSVTDDDLALLAESFPGFKELVLVCCDGFGTSGLAVVASKCRQLRVLDLIESEVMDDDVDWICCFPESQTCLESLIFECVECLVNFEALEKLVIRSPFLKKLRLNRFVSIGQLYRLMIRAPQLTHLGTGSFNTSEVNAQGDQELDYVSAFAACKSLVCLSGFREILLDHLPAIYPVCANLTNLNFSYANISAEQLKPVIRYCHKLQTFWVLDSVCDEGLKAVAATCKELRELRVFPVNAREDVEGPVSEVGLQAISEGCRKLQSILYFCQRMTNAAVVAMSKNCPDLVVFRLCIMGRHRADHVTSQSMDEGFGAIVMNCKKLTRLAVSGLLTDQAFSYIGQYGKLVRTLSVAFAGDSDMGLKYLLEGCPKLQKLEIRDSPFGDSALRSGLHHYYNMRFLWMSSCMLTRQGCRDVAQALPRLVVEVMKSDEEEETGEYVDIYMYRSLEGRRDDIPKTVEIM